mgnify:CR=1 FL=1
MKTDLDYSRNRTNGDLALTTYFTIRDEDLERLLKGESLCVDASPGMMDGPKLRVKFDIKLNLENGDKYEALSAGGSRSRTGLSGGDGEGRPELSDGSDDSVSAERRDALPLPTRRGG